MDAMHFFSSLSRVKKRVRSETRQSSLSPLSAPLFLLSQSVQDDPVSLPSSHSQTLNFHPIPGSRHQSSDLYCDIEAHLRMLGVSGDKGGGDGEEEEEEEEEEDGFYARVVGMKGSRCGKEEKRLKGWIRHYLGSKEEPLRLVHLMMRRIAVEDQNLSSLPRSAGSYMLILQSHVVVIRRNGILE